MGTLQLRRGGPLLAAVRGPLTTVASPVAEHGLQACGFQQLWLKPARLLRGLSSCGSWPPERRLSGRGARAQLLRGMWDPPGPGLEPATPALAGGPSTTAPPGKPKCIISVCVCVCVCVCVRARVRVRVNLGVG